MISVLPQPGLSPDISVVTITVEQSSTTTALPLADIQASNSTVFPAPSHSTVMSLGGITMSGGVVSTIKILAIQVISFPQASAAVNVTSSGASPSHIFAGNIKSLVIVVLKSQLSKALILSNQLFMIAALLGSSHSKTKSSGHSITGGVLSSIMIEAETTVALSHSSVAVKLTITSPVLSPQSKARAPKPW